MDRFSRATVAGVLALLVIAAVGADAQDQNDGGRRRGPPGGFSGFGGPGRGGDLFELLSAPEVRTHLKLTADEHAYVKLAEEAARDKAAEFRKSVEGLSREESRDKFMAFAREQGPEQEKNLLEIVGAERVARLKQIRLQTVGIAALFVPGSEAAAAVGITDEQRNKARAMMEATRSQMGEIFRSANGDREKLQAAFENFRKEQEVKYVELLTADQKTKWEALKGAPIDFKIDPRSRDRGPGGPGDRPRGESKEAKPST
ncbi:MAG: hypothetical protein ACRC1K_20540 [Planctomycetia bacterium]